MKKRLAFSALSVNSQPFWRAPSIDYAQLKQEIKTLGWSMSSKFRQGIAPCAEDTQIIYNGITCSDSYLLEPLARFEKKPEFQKLVNRMVAEFWDKIGQPFELACVGYRYLLNGSAPGNKMNWHQDNHMAKSGGMATWTGIHYSVDPTVVGGQLHIRPLGLNTEAKENILTIQPQDGLIFLFDNTIHQHSVEPVSGYGNRTTIIFTAKVMQ